jgi:DNA polymerase-3 subunit gamma/tau
MTKEYEFYKKHRPKLFKNIVGQREAVKTLEKLLKNKKKFPHTILFTGPSGCGKTTLGYILKSKLSCGDADFTEVDCADFRGIEMVREIRSRVHLTPIAGKCRVWLIDECHMLTNEAQNAFLKLLEKTPKHVYFFLATTDPAKLKTTIKTRATEIKVSPLARLDMDHLIASVADKEDLKISEEVVAKITECAEGSARKALVLLNQISELENEKEQLRAIESSDSKRQAIEIARALINPQTSWDKMCQVLKGIDEEPEQLRYLILGYCSTIMLSNNKRMMSRANLIINVFRDNLYDSKRAGLIANCFEVITSKTR